MHVQAWRETYAGLVPADMLATLNPVQRAARWRGIIASGTSTVLLLREHGEIIGFGSAGPQRDAQLSQAGEIGALYLLRAAQRRGFGRWLMDALARDLAARGLMDVSLWVLDKNLPARRFYESLGGQPILSRATERDGWLLNDTAYAWDDVTRLFQAR